MPEPDQLPESTEDDEQTTSIRLPKNVVNDLRILAEREEKTIENFLIALTNQANKEIQEDEEIRRVLAEWKIPRIVEIEALDDYLVRVKFTDELEGNYDMKSAIEAGGVFSHLADVEFFRKVALGEKGKYIFWPPEIDIHRDTIYWDLFLKDEW